MSFLPLPQGLLLLLALILTWPFPRRSRWALLGLLIIGGMSLGIPAAISDQGIFTQDAAAVLFQRLILLAALLAAVFKWDDDQATPSLLWATAGSMLLATANDLGGMFLSLELMALASLGLLPRSVRPKAFGYGLLGSLSFFFGGALLFGMTGTSSIPALAGRLSGALPVAILAAVLLFAGLAAKLMAAPFHQWAPDSLEVSELSTVFFFLTVLPIAAFAGMGRIFTFALGQAKGTWTIPAVLALLLAFFGLQVVALGQRTGKGFLIWMGLGQLSFVLLALAGFRPGFSEGMAGAWVHLLSLILALAGLTVVFLVVGDDLLALQGLWRRSKSLSLVALLSLLILAGLPPTIGFWGKFFLLVAAYPAMPWLVLLFGLSLLLPLYASLRLGRWLFLPREGTALEAPVPWLTVGFATLLFGFLGFFFAGWLWSTGLKIVFGF